MEIDGDIAKTLLRSLKPNQCIIKTYIPNS